MPVAEWLGGQERGGGRGQGGVLGAAAAALNVTAAESTQARVGLVLLRLWSLLRSAAVSG